MYPRASRRSSASTSGVSCSSAPSSPSPHARNSAVTAPGVSRPFSMGKYCTSSTANLAPRPINSAVFLGIFILQTGVRAFQREDGRLTVRRREGTMTRTFLGLTVGVIVMLGLAATARTICAEQTQGSTATAEDRDHREGRRTDVEVLDWNQIFIDTLIATNTANSSSQR